MVAAIQEDEERFRRGIIPGDDVSVVGMFLDQIIEERRPDVLGGVPEDSGVAPVHAPMDQLGGDVLGFEVGLGVFADEEGRAFDSQPIVSGEQDEASREGDTENRLAADEEENACAGTGDHPGLEVKISADRGDAPLENGGGYGEQDAGEGEKEEAVAPAHRKNAKAEQSPGAEEREQDWRGAGAPDGGGFLETSRELGGERSRRHRGDERVCGDGGEAALGDDGRVKESGDEARSREGESQWKKALAVFRPGIGDQQQQGRCDGVEHDGNCVKPCDAAGGPESPAGFPIRRSLEPDGKGGEQDGGEGDEAVAARIDGVLDQRDGGGGEGHRHKSGGSAGAKLKTEEPDRRKEKDSECESREAQFRRGIAQGAGYRGHEQGIENVIVRPGIVEVIGAFDVGKVSEGFVVAHRIVKMRDAQLNAEGHDNEGREEEERVFGRHRVQLSRLWGRRAGCEIDFAEITFESKGCQTQRAQARQRDWIRAGLTRTSGANHFSFVFFFSSSKRERQ